MNEERIRELLREMRDEAVPADSLARVRMGVESRATRSRARQQAVAAKAWGALAAAAVAVLVLAIAVWRHKPAQIETLPAPEIAQAVPAQAVPPVPEPREPVPVRRHAVQRAARTIPVRPVAAKAAEIRIETPDPNVVILLVGD